MNFIILRKVLLVGIGLFMMAGFLPAKSNDVMTEKDVALGCIFITCLEKTVCNEALGNAEFAADFSEAMEAMLCD